MKRILIIVVGLALLEGAGSAAFRMGWLSSLGLGTPGTTLAGDAGLSAPAAASGGPVSPAIGTGAASVPPSAPGTETPSPTFNGNLASSDWGGRIGIVTGFELGNDRASRLIDGQPRLWESEWEGPPKEIVVSFFEREPALVDAVLITSEDDPTPANAAKEVEIYTSTTSSTAGFVKVAAATLPPVADGKIPFDPVDTKFVKIRLVKNQSGGTRFDIREIKVMEAQRTGYLPLLTRYPEILGPLAPGAGGAPLTAPAAGPACEPTAAPLTPGPDKSRKVMVLTSSTSGNDVDACDGFRIKHDRKERGGANLPGLSVVDDITMQLLRADLARPWLLADKQGFDTVVLEQVCGEHTSMTPFFEHALAPWIAAGHKLIIHGADECAPGPDHSWLPYRIKTDNPGAQGARGDALKIVQDNWMAHNRKGRPGFVDTNAWLAGAEEFKNELGDSNVFAAWDANWCGHLVVENAAGVFGFTEVHARYGRGLIIYGGFDVDMSGTTGYDLMIAHELAQGFNPDNLPCSTRLGSVAITTEPQFVTRGVQPGQTYAYPLTLLSILKYQGGVTLSATASPAVAGLQARFEPVAVSDEHKATMTLPPGMEPAPVAIEVKGTSADGTDSTLCLQIGPPTSG
jgi:hypothetical protein